MKTFIIETEGDFDEHIILDALKDDFPEDDFKVREVHYCRDCEKYEFGYCKTIGFSEACKHFEEKKIKHSLCRSCTHVDLTKICYIGSEHLWCDLVSGIAAPRTECKTYSPHGGENNAL